jgi:hypothetical protein
MKTAAWLNTLKLPALAALYTCFFACSHTRTVHFTINSVPQGAYTTIEVDTRHFNRDPMFLGNTPISITREVDLRGVAPSGEIKLRAMLPGYFDGTKIYTLRSFLQESKSKGGIFWNFHLVESNRSH